MAYVFERKIIERFEVQRIEREFMSFKRFSSVRKDIKECEFCTLSFEPDDQTNLAFVNGKKNQLICDRCADKAIEGGAESSQWNKRGLNI